MNSFKFDCFNEDQSCLRETSDLRSDVQPIVASTIRNNYYDVKFLLRFWYAYSTNERLAKNYICNQLESFGYNGDLQGFRSLALALIRLYDKSKDPTVFEQDMLQMAISMFRDSHKQTAKMLIKFVSSQDIKYDHINSLMSHDCVELYINGNYSKEALLFSTALMFSLGLSDPTVKIPLGSLLKFSLARYSPGIDKQVDDSGIVKFTRLFNRVTGKSTKPSVPNVLKHDGRQRGEETQGLLSDDCIWHLNGLITHSRDNLLQSCTTNSTWSCCLLEYELSKDLPTVLKIMKYMVAPPSRKIIKQSERKDLLNILKEFKYKLSDNILNNVNPVVLACKHEEHLLDSDCGLFRKMYTNMGIGYTFNNAPFTKMFQNTTDNMAFFKEMHQLEEYNGQDSPKEILSNGKGYSFEFVFSHTGDGGTRESTDKKPKLMIHDPDMTAEANSEVAVLEAGMTYDISIIPSVTVTDSKGLQLGPKERKCLDKSEGEGLKIFGQYTQSACLFECQLALATEKCNCTPWDYPRLKDDIGICWRRSSTLCFKESMQLVLDTRRCNCPNDCSSVEYSISVQTKPFEWFNFKAFNFYTDDCNHFLNFDYSENPLK